MSSSSTTEEANASPTSSTSSDWKLDALRAKMKDGNIHALIVPTDDPHLSEYVPEAYGRRKFLTGFGGSAGTAIVTQDAAYLWTDSRYFNEAALQLDANHWKLMKQGEKKVPTIISFLAGEAVNSDAPYRVGIDPFVHPASFPEELKKAYDARAEKEGKDTSNDNGLELDTLDAEGNLVDAIWGSDRPLIPTSPFRVHPIEYAGQSVTDKVETIREAMKEKRATLSVFSALDDVAYLLNMRAKGDIDTCPVGIAYVTISDDTVTLYCNTAKVEPDEVKAHLKEANVLVKPYDDVVKGIEEHVAVKDCAKVWIDQGRANYALNRVIPEQNLINSQNAVTPMKACKNKQEMGGMHEAHVVDGVAMAHFIAWLGDSIVKEGRSVSEVEIDEVLTAFRAKQPGFIEVSFPTIAGVGANGAIIHYRATEGSDLLKYLDKNSPILIDSGGQYTYGTTDVTRTWHFGEASEEFKENYTRVLKGNIGVDSMVFPENTPGFVLDVFARKALWEAGKDYGHGTGHGVGAALNVHEGPHSISPRWANKEVMKKGMVVSNEPGYYEDGNFGIRIENLLECTYVNEEDNVAFDKGLVEGDEGFPEKTQGEKTFLKFKRLTQIPIQKNLIDVSIMTKSELDWLDDYHKEVFEKVSPLLQKDSPGFKWLAKACEKIER